MCEPAHSIVQYPHDYDDINLPFGGQVDKETRLKGVFQKVGAVAKKIGKWFHISKLGAGHAGASSLGYEELRWMPEPVDYEGFWWERTLKEDSLFGPSKATAESLGAAKQYHELVCSGNVRLFRRFLETSMRKTDRFNLYLSKFVEYVLGWKGRDQLLQKLRLILPGKLNKIDLIPSLAYNVPSKSKEKVIKAMMGYTRKRALFLPEWADDNRFWS